MSNRYSIRLWELEKIWVHRTIEIETETPKSEEDIRKMINDKSIYRYATYESDGDYCWNSAVKIGLDGEDIEVDKLN